MKRIITAEVNGRRSDGETEEAMGRHHTARHEVSPIKERTYWLSKEVEKKDPSG